MKDDLILVYSFIYYLFVSRWSYVAGVSYTGSEIINVHKTKEQREHNKTLFPNPNQNNNGSFVLRHLSPVHESLPSYAINTILHAP